MGYLLNVVYGLAILLSLPWIVFRSIQTGRYRHGWKEKLWGWVPASRPGSHSIWLHAVSVGEVQLLRTLVQGIEKKYPETSLFISTTTRAGMEIAAQSFARHQVFYMPLDFTWGVRNALKRIQPRLIVLIELEVWPNLIDQAQRFSCPVAVVNGRLSEKSFRGYHRLRWALAPTFAKLSLVAAQDKVYAERFRQMGTPSDRVLVTGNLKFDGACEDRMHPEVVRRSEQLGLGDDELVWVAGSTQAPEEALVLEAFQRLKKDFPHLKLILVPRQPDRFDEVAALASSLQLSTIRRSRMTDERSKDWELMIGDTLGELRWWWGLADIAFVGGSFGDRGGQNMIEPAAFGVATAVGPNTKNFADTVRILKEGNGLTQLREPRELFDWANAHLASATLRSEAGNRARQVTTLHRGALERTLAALQPWLFG